MFHTKKRMLLALFRLEEGMQEVLARLEEMGTPPSVGHTPDSSPQGEPTPSVARGDEWLKNGIDSILSYQAGAKKRDGEEEKA